MRATAALVAAVVLGAGCGSGGDRAGTAPTSTRPSTTTAAGGSPSGLAVRIVVTGRYPRGAVHVIRVERPDGSQVFEHTVGSDMRLEQPLPAGSYRVLSFQRECRTTCGSSPSADTLGEPVDICGSYFDVNESVTTTAVVEVVAQQGCTITFD